MKYGKFFKQYRKEAGMSQQQVADILKIHQSNVSDWENDVARPEYEKLIKLAEIYGVTVGELLGVNEY